MFIGPREAGAGGVITTGLSLGFKHHRDICAIISSTARDLAHSFEIKLPLKQSAIPSELSQL